MCAEQKTLCFLCDLRLFERFIAFLCVMKCVRYIFIAQSNPVFISFHCTFTSYTFCAFADFHALLVQTQEVVCSCSVEHVTLSI